MTTSQNLEADRLLNLVRSDLILKAESLPESQPMQQAIVDNLRRLADVMEQGGVPDPHLVFHHPDRPDVRCEAAQTLKCYMLHVYDYMSDLLLTMEDITNSGVDFSAGQLRILGALAAEIEADEAADARTQP